MPLTKIHKFGTKNIVTRRGEGGHDAATRTQRAEEIKKQRSAGRKRDKLTVKRYSDTRASEPATSTSVPIKTYDQRSLLALRSLDRPYEGPSSGGVDDQPRDERGRWTTG